MGTIFVAVLTVVIAAVALLSIVGLDSLLKTASPKHRMITGGTYVVVLTIFVISIFVSIWS